MWDTECESLKKGPKMVGRYMKLLFLAIYIAKQIDCRKFIKNTENAPYFIFCDVLLYATIQQLSIRFFMP